MDIRPYQDAPAPPMTAELREACKQAVHVVDTDDTILRGGRAVLFAFDAIGWRWRARILRLPPLVWCVDLGYWIVSRNRSFFARFMFRKEYPPPQPPAA